MNKRTRNIKPTKQEFNQLLTVTREGALFGNATDRLALSNLLLLDELRQQRKLQPALTRRE